MNVYFSFCALTVVCFSPPPQRKRKAKLKSDGQVNGVDPLVEDDDDRLKEIARKFEEKYVSTAYTWKIKLTLSRILYIYWFEHKLSSYQRSQLSISVTL
jgi:hypothetical protein